MLPTLFGEKIVLRLLDKSNLQLDMTKLGFEEKPLADFMKAIHQPYGMVLVTGPTGSGKTTTLYSALSELNKTDAQHLHRRGSRRVQPARASTRCRCTRTIGLNFATALRSFLRQDPNIIMVGEIRDFETAEIAVKAALTGHLVLSTLHTNDAPSTISRLLNMGIEPFLVTASVNLILAQRLARKICSECKAADRGQRQGAARPRRQADEQSQKLQARSRAPAAAPATNTGYKGRIALYEVMPFTEPLKELVLQGASTAELKAEAIRGGMKTLRMSGIAEARSRA